MKLLHLKRKIPNNLNRRRIGAFFTDLFCMLMLLKLVKNSYFYLVSYSFKEIPYLQNQLTSNLSSVNLLLFYTITVGYSIFFLYFCNGKTVGGTLFSISVTSMNFGPENPDKKLPLAQVLSRTLGNLICLSAAVTVILAPICLIPFVRQDKRGLPDFLSKGQVMVDEKKDLILQQAEENDMQAELFPDFEAA